MPGNGLDNQWPDVIAAVAIRLQISTNEVRAMRWVDFRAVLKKLGANVGSTRSELEHKIQRLIGNG